MPYLHISTNIKLSDAQVAGLRKAVYDLIGLIPGKTYEVTMIHIDDNQLIHLNEVDAPCAFVDARLMGPAPFADKQNFVQAFTGALTDVAGIDAKHAYFNIIEMSEWGAGGNYNHI